MLRKLAEGIHLWSFSKTWSIVTHAEIASFISDDVIRTRPFFPNPKWGLTEDLCYETLKQNKKRCDRKLICILLSDNLSIPRCPRNTLSSNNIHR